MPQTGVEHTGDVGHKMLGKKLKLSGTRYKWLNLVKKIVSHLFVYCKADFKPSSMQAICLYLRKGQTVFSIYLFDLFSDLRIDAETEHIRLGRCHNVFHFGFLLT